MDFTVDKYEALLRAAQAAGYQFLTFAQFAEQGFPENSKCIILRHDVDRLPGRSERFAEVERELGIPATYFFRIKRESFRPEIIRKIASGGHEIGFHYEDLCDAKGDHELAWELFCANLKRLRQLTSITSIAMHGRPFCPWDNRDLWNSYDYRSEGITIEAYHDLPWEQMSYFTDTGRSWNSEWNEKDRPRGVKITEESRSCATSDQLIALLSSGTIQYCCISTHPERWPSSIAGWLQVRFVDFATNLAKRMLRWRRARRMRNMMAKAG